MAKKNSITLIQKYIEGNARTQSPFLNIANSGITELPASIGDLVHLKSLYLGGNAISMLPPEISNLRNLERLSLSGNPLNHFPPQIINLKSLIKLSLRGTKIAKLPHEIGKLSNINDLDISNNYLTELPIEIQKLNKLRILDLDGNLLNLPPEIVTRRNDPESIFSYYFSLKKEQKKRLNEIKILVVGQGSVGKTSIICRLLGGEYNSGQSKTEGITINRWQIDLPSKIDKKRSKFQLNIWDFGGQEIMHATHQFFLTKRSLYLLVLDSRLSQEANRVEYWLKIIQSFGGDSPVLIVGNKIDQHPLDIDRTGLRKKYETIVDILETSAMQS